MKMSYTGGAAGMLPKQRAKIEAKLAKIVKNVEWKGEKEVHVMLSQTRHLHKAEITMHAYDHTLVGAGSDGDLVTAMSAAVEKLEKQVLKIRTKWRDTHRHEPKKFQEAEPVAAPAAKETRTPPKARPKVFRVDHRDGRKPMTLEEAMLEMGAGQDYLVYRDSKTDKVCTLLRRGDGHLDLIES